MLDFGMADLWWIIFFEDHNCLPTARLFTKQVFLYTAAGGGGMQVAPVPAGISKGRTPGPQASQFSVSTGRV